MWIKKSFKLWIQIKTNNNLPSMICCENIVNVALLKNGLVEKKGVLITKVMAK